MDELMYKLNNCILKQDEWVTKEINDYDLFLPYPESVHMDDSGEMPRMRQAVQLIQYNFKCCGVNGSKDYTNWPSSCCGSDNFGQQFNRTCLNSTIKYQIGCSEILRSVIPSFLSPFGTIEIIKIILQLFVCLNIWLDGKDEQDFKQFISCPKLRKKYFALDKIDEGGFGIVYKAKHRETKKLYAIKFLKIESKFY